MASPKSYNYWVEIFAGGRTWVNLSGDPMTKIVFCVKAPIYSEGSTFAIDLRPGPVDEEIENFPVNLQPKIPDFDFTINCGYTSPDGSFSTPDVISALEEVNRYAGYYFSLVGCRFALVAGEAADSGQWWDGTYWRDSVNVDIPSTAPTPSAPEIMHVVHSGVISDVETDGVETTTIRTSFPDESCTTGEVVGNTDNEDSIKVLNYSSQAQNEISVKLANGLVATSDTVSNAQLFYVPAGTAKKYLVNPDSYGITSEGLDIRRGILKIKLLTANSFASSGLVDVFPAIADQLHLTNSDYSTRMERYTLVGESFPEAEPVVETVCFAKNSEYTVSGYFQHKVDGAVIDPNFRFVDGRQLDGTPLAEQVNFSDPDHGLFESSSNGDRKYKANISLVEYPTGVWVDNASIDLVAENENSPWVPARPYILGKGGNGSASAFLKNSVSGAPYSSAWKASGNSAMPVICYSNEESGDFVKISRARIRVSFDQFKKLNAGVISLKIYVSGRFSAHNTGPLSPPLNTHAYLRLSALPGESGGEGFRLKTLSDLSGDYQEEQIFDYTAGPVYDYTNTYDANGNFFLEIKQFAEIWFDCEWQYENQSVFDDTDDQLGSFAICGVKIEAVCQSIVEDGDTFILSCESSIGGEARDVVNDLYSKFCPAQTLAPSLHPIEIDASINATEPIRETVRDVLASSLVTSIRNFETDTETTLGFELKNAWSVILENPVTFTEDNVISEDIPEVFVKNAKLTEIYNAYQINYDYDPALKSYNKMIYVDANGVKTRNCSSSGFEHIVTRCQYANSIYGVTKRLFKKEMRFASDTGAENFIDLVSMFLSWPRKTAQLTATLFETVAEFTLLNKVTFSGSKFPPALLSREWIITGFSKSAIIDDGVNTIKLMEFPQWPS